MRARGDEVEDYRKVSVLPLDDTQSVWFATYTLGQRRLGCARVFSDTPKYSGPTPSGVDLTLDQLEILVPALDGVSARIESGLLIPPVELCRIPGGRDYQWVAQVIEDERADAHFMLDIRKYVDAEKFKGWRRGGLHLPVDYIDDVAFGLLGVVDALEAHRDGRWGLFEQEPHIPEAAESTGTDSVPDEYHDYF